MNAALWPMAEVLPFARPLRDGDGRPWQAAERSGAAAPDPDDGHAAADESSELDDVFDADAATDTGGGGSAAGPRVRSASLNDSALAALIARIVDRDARALESLYDASSSRVYGLALRITRRQALAEEVVEDTFWQVWRQAARFDATRGEPMAWLLAMARSRAIDALRRDERFRHDELPEEGLLDGEAGTPPPQDLLDASRGSAALHAALQGLDAKARQLVALAFFRGLTHEEIAAQEAMPLGSVKSLIRRSLQQLRRALEAAGSRRA